MQMNEIIFVQFPYRAIVDLKVLFSLVIFELLEFLSVQYTKEKFGVQIISRQIQSQFQN